MSSHFTEQSNVALARQLSWSKRSKFRAPSTRPTPTALYRRAGSKRGEDFLQRDKGRGNTTLSICKLQTPARLVGRERWMGCCNWIQKWPKRRPGRGVAQLELYGVEENFARAPAWQTTAALRVTGCRFFIPPMHNALSAPQCATARQVPPSTPRIRDTPLEPMPCAHVQFAIRQVTSEMAAGVGLCAACIIRA
jgi:hypothetical protein